jgi:hypothetical protein
MHVQLAGGVCAAADIEINIEATKTNHDEVRMWTRLPKLFALQTAWLTNLQDGVMSERRRDTHFY